MFDRKRSVVAGLLCASVALVGTGAAIAAGDSVSIQAPPTVKKGHVLKTTLSGTTAGARSVGYFVGYSKCAANSKKEAPISVAGIAYGKVIGHFSHLVDTTPLSKSGYLCAYVQAGPLDRHTIPTGRVTAKSSRRYTAN